MKPRYDAATLALAISLAACRQDSALPTHIDAAQTPSFARSSGVVTVTDLGVLPGDAHSAAYGANDAGQVVGTSWGGPAGQGAFYWGNGRLDDLSPGVRPSSANAIGNATAAGLYVAGYQIGADGNAHAVRWTLSRDPTTGALVSSPELLDQQRSEAHGINDKGQVAGLVCVAQCAPGENPLWHGALWDSPNSRETIAPLGGPCNYVRAHAQDVNNDGLVVGFSVKSPINCDIRGFIRLTTGELRELPPMDGDSGSDAFALSDVNAEGLVYVVGRTRNINEGRPVRWTVVAATGTVVDAVVLAGSAQVAGNPGVHNAGHVAASRASGKGYRAFLWRAGQFQELSPLKGYGQSIVWTLNDGATRSAAPLYVAGASQSSSAETRATRWKIN